MNNSEPMKARLDKLATVRRKPAIISEADLIKRSYLHERESLPLVLQPNVEGVSPSAWFVNNREAVEESLLRHGGILFRGFGINSQSDFEQFLLATGVPLSSYMESATPRTKLSTKVYTSTEFPADQTIHLHNELSYVSTFPMKIWFCCLKPAEQGGETPIADVRKIYQRLAPRIREAFIQKGWRLVRNFGYGLGPTWQDSFHLTRREQVENYFQQAGIDFEWRSETHLRTRQIRPAVARHPKTGEMVWLNHIAFWHISSLEPSVREAMLAVLDEEEFPYNTYFGDGSPIDSSVIEEINNAYDQETITFQWQKGDILMLDNMLVAHGRKPFVGSRQVIVAMGEPFERDLQLRQL